MIGRDFQSPGDVEDIMKEQPLEHAPPLLVRGVQDSEDREPPTDRQRSCPHLQVQGRGTLLRSPMGRPDRLGRTALGAESRCSASPGTVLGVTAGLARYSAFLPKS